MTSGPFEIGWPRNVRTVESCWSAVNTYWLLELTAVARPRRRRRFDVGLGVVADAEQEQLEQLAAEVLVRRVLAVVGVVEVAQHRRLDRHRLGERPHVAEAAVAEQLVLLHHRPGVEHLAPLAAEVPVPEERHLLLDRPRSTSAPCARTTTARPACTGCSCCSRRGTRARAGSARHRPARSGHRRPPRRTCRASAR